MTHVRHLALIALLAVGAISAHAQDSADITINFEVAEVRVVELDTDAVDLVLETADNNSVFESKIGTALSATFTYNGSANQKITVSLDADMPGGLRLELNAGFGSHQVYELNSGEQVLILKFGGPFNDSE